MGTPANPKPALLFTGILYSDESYLSKAKESLLSTFGAALLETPPVSWDYSEYYKEEIGSPIMRTFIFFKGLINRAEIADIKLRTNDIETSLSTDGKETSILTPDTSHSQMSSLLQQRAIRTGFTSAKASTERSLCCIKKKARPLCQTSLHIQTIRIKMY